MVYTINLLNPYLSNKKRINKIIASFLLVYRLCLFFCLLASDLSCFFSHKAIQILILRLSLLVKHYNNYLPLSNFALHITKLHYATNVYTETAANECKSFQHDEIHWEGWHIPYIIALNPCIRFYQQMYILRVRLGRNISLSELLWDTIIASIMFI